jgi:hypothetical protein
LPQQALLQDLAFSGRIVPVPANEPLSAFMLKYAFENDAYIVSNDTFKAFYQVGILIFMGVVAHMHKRSWLTDISFHV